ncbi:MAG: FG-GAP-like repeat-containing protein [Bacteroidia bacterium]|nr:FG-GAP-like repeat-containing protein [Bacteroidia bacterium]
MKKIILLLSIFVLITYNSTAQLCLSTQKTVPVTSPSKIIHTDLNGDGKMDLVTSNSSNPKSISVMLADIFGVYSTVTSISGIFSGFSPISLITSADFNSDGKKDLVINISTDSLKLLLGNGLGGFSNSTKIFLGANTFAVDLISSDFNNDGKADLAVSLFGKDSIAIFLGNGMSGFNTVKYFAAGNQQRAFISSDFNADGKMDLATVNEGSNNFSILLGNGIGGFVTTNFNFPLSSRPNSITSADFNGDNKKDLAITCLGLDSNVLLYSGNGTGSFAISKKLKTNLARQIFSPDINLDGKNDLVISTAYSTVYLAYGNGVGGFSSLSTFFLDTIVNSVPNYILCADLNNDNKLDFASCFSNGVNVSYGLLGYTLTKNNASCNRTKDGSASLVISCGKPPYSYLWNTIPVKTTSSISGLSPGSYSVKVTDASNSSTTLFFEIENGPPLEIEMTTTPNTKCSGKFNGTAEVNVLTGTSPYTYLWDSFANNQRTQTAIGLSHGFYQVKITDANGCTSNDSIPRVAGVDLTPQTNPNIYLTNLAAIDQTKLSPAFASFYSYNLPTTINANPANPRNFVDAGKKARFKVECTNQKANGQSIVSGICKVRSNSPYIKITDSSSALNNIGWSNKAWSADEFEIDIDPKTPPGQSVYIDFVVQENGQDYATTCISIPVSPLVYSTTTSATIDDDNNPDSKGNDNDICDPNETIEFYPWLDNITALNAEYVRGRFENLDNHSFIKIWNDTQGVNTRVFDATWWNYSFAKPQTINFMSTNTTPEYDFVFDYKNNAKSGDFKLYMVMAGGFKLFNGDALSLVQWSLPFNFSGNGLNDSLNITPQNLSYSSVASSKQVTVNCNRSWLVNASQPWVTFNKTSGNGNDMLNVIVTENPTSIQRTATATFTAGSNIKTVTIIQDATVGVNEVNKINHISIYPNPTSGIVTISSNQTIVNIEVFDVTGKAVFSQQNNSHQTNLEIDLSALSNGIYFINVQNNFGGISKSKLVVSK